MCPNVFPYEVRGIAVTDMDKWLLARFGEHAQQFVEAIPQALAEAHASSAAAQSVAETARKDPYGHTMKVRQHEALVTASSTISGASVQRPTGGQFDLVVIPETATVLLPFRYSTDRKKSRESAKLRCPVSDLRIAMLGDGIIDTGQLTFDQIGIDPTVVAAEQEERHQLTEQLRDLVRTVVIGYGSNYETGVWGIGLGEVRILDALSGEVEWTEWFPIAATTHGTVSNVPLRSVIDLGDLASTVERFDVDQDDDSLDLTARRGDPEVPISEPTRALRKADSDGDPE